MMQRHIRPVVLALVALVVADLASARATSSQRHLVRPRSFTSCSRGKSLIGTQPQRGSIISSPSNPYPYNLSRVTSIRGGSSFDFDDTDDDGEYDDDFDSDFDFEDGDGMFDFDAAEEDFGDESFVTSMASEYKKTPPLTKAYLTASFGAAMLGYATNKNDFPSLLQLDWKPTLTRLQIWRPLTAFLNFGPMGIGYLMTAHFVWTYMSTLERLNHSAPYDFWLMIFFGAASMVVGYSVMGLSPRFLGHNLSTFLVYVWSRYHEGLEVNMFELFNTRAEMLPWFFLAQVSNVLFFACIRFLLKYFLWHLTMCYVWWLSAHQQNTADLLARGRSANTRFFGNCLRSHIPSLQNNQRLAYAQICHSMVQWG